MKFLEIACSYMGEFADETFGPEGCGSVIGVFRHGWYLSDGTFVWLLHDRKHGEVPFGVGIEDFERVLPYKKTLERGEVVWTEDTIQIPDAGVLIHRRAPEEKRAKQQVCFLELGNMRERACPLLMEKGRGRVRDLLNDQNYLLSGIMDRNIVQSAEDDIFLQRARTKLIALFGAMKTGDSDRFDRSLRKLIGFGNGLTPSMDDWLTGFLYVLLRAQVSDAAKERIDRLADTVLAVVSDCTNRISEAYVSAAARGLCFEQLDRVLYAACDADVEQLLDFGSSSGSDMMTGMIFAALYLENAGYIKI